MPYIQQPAQIMENFVDLKLTSPAVVKNTLMNLLQYITAGGFSRQIANRTTSTSAGLIVSKAMIQKEATDIQFTEYWNI